jgi:hypothetical protein
MHFASVPERWWQGLPSHVDRAFLVRVPEVPFNRRRTVFRDTRSGQVWVRFHKLGGWFPVVLSTSSGSDADADDAPDACELL